MLVYFMVSVIVFAEAARVTAWHAFWLQTLAETLLKQEFLEVLETLQAEVKVVCAISADS
jgi:hypothetical protein